MTSLGEMTSGDRCARSSVLSRELMEVAQQLTSLLEEMAAADQAKQHKLGSEEAPAFGFSSDAEERQTRQCRLPLPDPRLVRRIIHQRNQRLKFFGGELFADPAWDILLDLTAARAEYRRVSVTSLCIASGVPPTTALRWIRVLNDEGLVERVEDDMDKRRAFISLSERGADAMACYFASLGATVERVL